MILTTPTKHSCTTTKHNNKSYIFTLYLFMLLCVVGNCLLFYCSCTGNCENCCRINGNASVSGGINDKSEIKIGNKNKLKEVDISNDGKIGNIQIVNAEFVNKNLGNVLIKKLKYEKDNYKEFGNKFIKEIEPTGETYLSAYVEVKKNDNVVVCFIHCTDANSKIDGNVTYGLFQESKATKIEILSCGSNIENMRNMFYWCSSLTELNLSNFKTNNVTDMSFMFSYCSNLTNLNLSNFTTENVTNMSYMFKNCSKLRVLNLSNFNTNNVINMYCMFYWCISLTNLNLSNFNTTNVTNMEGMFYWCISLTNLNLSQFNTNKVTDMQYMFANCFKNNATLICTAITIQKITDKTKFSWLTIQNDNKNKEAINKTLNNNLQQVYTCTVERWENECNPQITSVVESNKADLFKLRNIPKSGKIDDIQIVRKEFVNLVKYVPIVGNEDYKQIIDDDSFMASIALTGGKYLFAYVEVENKDTVKLRCFIHCTNANSKKVGDIFYGLFQESKATKIVILSCGSEIKDMFCMFFGCSSLTILDLSSFNTNNVKDMSYMFYKCSSLTNIDLSSFNTKKVTDMSNMFNNCSSLTNIKFPDNFNTINVTDMSWMFFNCSSLKNLDLSKFNTDKVTDMKYMFSNCSSLIALDLSNFNTNNVKDMRFMFKNCSSLTNLDLSKLNTNNVKYMRGMFYRCFTEEQSSTLICTASTIQKITDKAKKSCLIIEDKDDIKKTIANDNNNIGKVYTCTVERVGNEDNPQITEVEEYNKAGLLKLKNMPESGKINDIKIVNAEFVKKKLVNAYVYKGNSDNYEAAKNEFIKGIDKKCETHLSAYVEGEKDNKMQLQCFIHCENADSIGRSAYIYDGLFEGSKATKIEILSCGNNITNMSWMFADCSSLTELKISSFNTQNVTYMSYMFYNCNSLTNLDLSNFNTDKVEYMSWIFFNCSSLKELNLSNFNTQNVTNMQYMFNKCFTEEHHSTLICTASTIQKITDKAKKSYLIIEEKKKDEITEILHENNPDKVYTCTVERVVENSKIISIKEQQVFENTKIKGIKRKMSIGGKPTTIIDNQVTIKRKNSYNLEHSKLSLVRVDEEKEDNKIENKDNKKVKENKEEEKKEDE